MMLGKERVKFRDNVHSVSFCVSGSYVQYVCCSLHVLLCKSERQLADTNQKERARGMKSGRNFSEMTANKTRST